MKKIAGNKNYRLIKKGDDLGAAGPSVYVVTMNIDYEGSTVQAVFSSEAKAQAAIDAARPVEEWDGFKFDITSYQMDKVPDGNDASTWRLASAEDEQDTDSWSDEMLQDPFNM